MIKINKEEVSDASLPGGTIALANSMTTPTVGTANYGNRGYLVGKVWLRLW